ncbi:MAG: YitT family protein [Sphingobacteriaceae bacterium]|nr:YitT family protein [Cytophagaceae bacterium]
MPTPATRYRPLLDAAFIVAGILCAGLGLKGFLLSSRFIDGGVTGVSMLLADVVGAPLALWIVVINVPFIALGYRRIGRVFAVKSILAIGGLAACLALVPYPDVTPDLLLTAIFGGFFIGAGIGLAMRGGAVLDGTEVAALLISRTSSLLKVGDVIMLMNVFIFGAAAFFLSIESALYSMITYFAASRTVDFVVHGIEQYTAVLIVSKRHERLRQALVGYGWGVTIVKGEGGSGREGKGHTHDVLYTVVTRLELPALTALIDKIDPEAFFIHHAVDDVNGGKIKSLPLH